MKFRIECTVGDNPPEAKEIRTEYWQTFHETEEEFNKKATEENEKCNNIFKTHYKLNLFRDGALEVKIFPDKIMRRFEDTIKYEIEFNTLEELLEYIRKHDDIIIFHDDEDDEFWLELYNDYRE